MGLAIGGATAYRAISKAWGIEVIDNNGWRSFENLAIEQLDVYARAYLAQTGHLPLPLDQAIYFHTFVDEYGDRLASSCDYEISGGEFSAYWWSISLHDTDFKRFENPAHRYSFNMTNLIRFSDGRYKVNISADVKSGNWLPLSVEAAENNIGFMVSLRLYGIDKNLLPKLPEIKLPKISKLGCL